MLFFSLKNNLYINPICHTCSFPVCNHTLQLRNIKNKFLEKYLNMNFNDFKELIEIVYDGKKPELPDIDQYFSLKKIFSTPFELLNFYSSINKNNDRNDNKNDDKNDNQNDNQNDNENDNEKRKKRGKKSKKLFFESKKLEQNLMHQNEAFNSHSFTDTDLKVNNNDLTVNNTDLTVGNTDLTVNNNDLTVNNNDLTVTNTDLTVNNSNLVTTGSADLVTTGSTDLVTNICPICKMSYDPFDYNIEMIQCDFCYRWIHIECDKSMTAEEYELIENKEYFCVKCIEWKRKVEIFHETDKKITEKYKEKRQKYNIQSRCIICGGSFRNLDIFNSYSDMEMHYLMPTFYAHRGCRGKIVGNCKLCNKSGATLGCHYCQNPDLYHLRCSLGKLIVSDIQDLACENHRKAVYSDFILPKKKEENILPVNSDFNIKSIKKILSSMNFTKEISEDEICIRLYDYVYFENNHYLKIIYGREINIIEFRRGKYFLNFKEDPNVPVKYDFDVNEDFFNLGNLDYIRSVIPNFKGEIGRILREKFLDEYRFSESDCDCECTSGDFNRRGEISCIYFGNLLQNHTLSYLAYVLQKRPYILGKSRIEGYGLFANKDFVPNEPIIQYFGELITAEEADKREKYYENRIYMFKLEDTIFDATVIGNLARYINHSCNPNCYSTKVLNCGMNILICAKRYILKGEELTYDYKLTKGTKLKCRCGSYNCRIFLK